MNNSVFFAVVLLGITPILLVVMLAVRFAGKTPILNFVDYAAIRHPAELHKRVGNILLVLPALSASSGVLALNLPDFAGGVIAAFVVLSIGFVWFAVLSANRASDSTATSSATEKNSA